MPGYGDPHGGGITALWNRTPRNGSPIFVCEGACANGAAEQGREHGAERVTSRHMSSSGRSAAALRTANTTTAYGKMKERV